MSDVATDAMGGRTGTPTARRRSPGERVTAFLARFSIRTKLAVLGSIVSVGMVLGTTSQLVVRAENYLYDIRARRCQGSFPPPANLVHIDIDDASLEAVGKWPWPRRVLAKAIDELIAAGARRVGMDLLFPESSNPKEWIGQTYASTRPSGVVDPSTDDDALLGDAIARAGGRVLLPISLNLRAISGDSEIVALLRSKLSENPEADGGVLAIEMAQNDPSKATEIADIVKAQFEQMRREVILEIMLKPPRKTLEQQRQIIGHRADAPLTKSGQFDEIVREQFAKAEAIWELWKTFDRRVTEQQTFLRPVLREDAPIEQIARRAGGYGFVEYYNDDDGIVRSVPLLVNHHGRMAPQMGLALACSELGVHPQNVNELQVFEDRIVLAPPGQAVHVIPLYTQYQRGGRVPVGASMRIPWQGTRDWPTMYDTPGNLNRVPHLPFALLAAILRNGIELRKTRDAVQMIQKTLADPLPKLPDAVGRDEMEVQRTLAAAAKDYADNVVLETENFPQMGLEEIAITTRLLRSYRFLLSAQTLAQAQVDARAALHAAVFGRVVVMGWTATGAAADFVPTPIHDKCPGPVIHGAIFNAIMTDSAMRMGPEWLNRLITLLFGLTATWVMVQAAPQATPGSLPPATTRVSRLWRRAQWKLSPVVATVLGVSLLVLWSVLNGYVLFRYKHYVLALASPILAVLLVWALGLLMIAAEQFIITRLFHGYLDPKLVSYLRRNPANTLFETRRQKVTVCFSDIAGFTTMTEELKEAMIPLLQDYLYRMVTVIRKHGGVVNKFMGDGIMFIFGAPERVGNPEEAALRCVLEMQEALATFNADNRSRLRPEHYRELLMRCGVNTGEAYCGDAGPLEAREYTALGDTTNVAARLETANKDCGTALLVSASTVNDAALARNLFLFRHVGVIRLRNRQEAIEAYELVCLDAAATAEQREHARLVQTMVDNFQSGDFDACIRASLKLKEARYADVESFGTGKLAGLYIGCAETARAAPEGEAFARHIVSQG